MLEKYWPKQETYIKKFYRVSPKDTNTKSGKYIEFEGVGSDTSFYTIGYYKKDKKDSIWVKKYERGMIIEKYRNGKRYGKREGFYNNGNRSFIEPRLRKIGKDTAITWWENGQIFEFEIFKDGKNFFHECYDSLGNKQPCPSG